MGVLDLELQRERRVQMLREAESKRVVGRWRSGIRQRTASRAWRLASFWTIDR